MLTAEVRRLKDAEGGDPGRKDEQVEALMSECQQLRQQVAGDYLCSAAARLGNGTGSRPAITACPLALRSPEAESSWKRALGELSAAQERIREAEEYEKALTTELMDSQRRQRDGASLKDGPTSGRVRPQRACSHAAAFQATRCDGLGPPSPACRCRGLRTERGCRSCAPWSSSCRRSWWR